MSDKDIQAIFDNLIDIDDEMSIDKLFDYCNNHGISDEQILKMFDGYLDKKFPKNKKMKSMQVGSGIANTIGLSKRPNYKVILYNY